MTELILLGVVHGDERVAQAISVLKPTLITCEMNVASWSRMRYKAAYAEVLASVNSSTPCVFVDHPSYVHRSTNGRHQDASEVYTFLQKHYTSPNKETEEIVEGDDTFAQRTQYMTEMLLSLYSQQSGRILHVGGAGHFLHTKNPTMYTYLRPFGAKRYLLSELLK